MLFARWNKRYSVGHEGLDIQHRKFFFLMRKLHEAAEGGAWDPVLGEAIEDLSGYARNHFHDEERIMWTSGYPGLALHRRQHAYFNDQVASLKSRFIEGRLAPPVAVLDFLLDWFVNHIADEDKKYAPYVCSQPSGKTAS